MKAEIISTGTEIMIGSIVNTNVQYLSKRLQELGVETLYHTSVDDNRKRIEEAITIAFNRVDLIILTGGLGPTDDDVTKFVIADFLNLECYIDPIELERIGERFSRNNIKMSENNKKQAMLPKGAKWLINDLGTASGIMITFKGKTIISMPGPPQEMKPMFEKYYMDFITRQDYITTHSINTIGLGESDLEMELKKIPFDKRNVEIATFAKRGYIEVNLIARGKNPNIVEKRLEKNIGLIKKHLSKYIFGEQNESIEAYLINQLIQREKKLSIVESCTGGDIISNLIKVEGASKVIIEGLVAYSLESKQKNLNYDQKILEKYGVYSEEFSKEMANRMLYRTNSDISIATTGVTTLDENEPDVQPGTLFVTVMNKEHSLSKTYSLKGNRKDLIHRMTMRSFSLLNEFLQNYD